MLKKLSPRPWVLFLVAWFVTLLCLGNFALHPPATAVTESAWDNLLAKQDFTAAVTAIEKKWESDYESYFGRDLATMSKDAQAIAAELTQLSRRSQTNGAVIWMFPRDNQLELILITPGQSPIGRSVTEANQRDLLLTIRQLQSEIQQSVTNGTHSYLKPAQTLYDWMIKPVKAHLDAANIDTLILCVGGGLRSLPMGALHDGDRFLVEQYSLSIIPAYNLTPMGDRRLENPNILAMGASEFDRLAPLPAVPMELAEITQGFQGSRVFLNRDFTLENLLHQRQQDNFNIVHLATHAAFNSGFPNNSFIQFWGKEKLGLDDLKRLKFDRPPVKLLVLSACETAVGDPQAEFGFAGLAIQAGVETAVASVWAVSDAGTLALMNEFYRQLPTAPTKAAALRAAQMALLSGSVRFENGELLSVRGAVALPPDLSELTETSLSHPYYWAAFTTIGSPF